jgi:translation initiation factor IF-3
MDFSRYYYELKKKNRKKTKTVHLKQVRLSPNIGKHDLKVKFKHIKEFIEHGQKVRVNMRFRGRQKEHQELGREILNAIIKQLEEIATCQSEPKFEGYYMTTTLVPGREKPKTDAKKE